MMMGLVGLLGLMDLLGCCSVGWSCWEGVGR
jgi:hypothetical protein